MRHTIIALAAIVSLPTAALAQQSSREDTAMLRTGEIVGVMRGEIAPEEVFSPSFLRAVPAAQLKALSDQLIEQNGALLSANEQDYEGNGSARFDLTFEKAKAESILQLTPDAPYLVSGFRILKVGPKDDDPQKILDDFMLLPGNAGFGVYILTPETASGVLLQNAEEQFAIGSTFKLWVLSALAQEIKQGKRHWTDIVPLGAPSLPSGHMQDWPKNTPVTLQTLATMMISISDNTATDTLIRLLGRETIEAEVIASGHREPERNQPFLTTIEMFALKSGNEQRLAAYQQADGQTRRRLLQEWAASLTRDNVDLGKIVGNGPTAIDSVEWFASAEDIARIFMRLRDVGDPTVLDILAVNPSVSETDQAKWSYVGYKGGSETGVLNLSWLFKTELGAWYVVTTSWNNAENALDDTRLELLAARLIDLIADGSH